MVKLSEEKTKEILEWFRAPEGFNTVYYGQIRQGKTASATFDIWDLLTRGEIVYANYKIKFPGFDETKSKKRLLEKLIFGSKILFNYSHKNFHYIEPDGLITGEGEINVKYLNRLVGVHLFIDEGQWVLPSLDKHYDDDMVAKMKLVLHGGHYCRSLNILTQRPQNVSKNSRSQINVWIRCVKRFEFLGFIWFSRYIIQDIDNECLPIEYVLDEKGRQIANGVRKDRLIFAPLNKILNSYDTHGMRGNDAIEDRTFFEAYGVSFWDKVRLILFGRKEHNEKEVKERSVV